MCIWLHRDSWAIWTRYHLDSEWVILYYGMSNIYTFWGGHTHTLTSPQCEAKWINLSLLFFSVLLWVKSFLSSSSSSSFNTRLRDSFFRWFADSIFIDFLFHYLACSSDRTSSRKRPKTSVLCAPARRASVTKTRHSIASFRTSCAKVETSPTTTELVANRSTERNSPTRTSHWSTPDRALCRWPTPDRTQTVPSSSSLPFKPAGWTTVTSSSVTSSRAWTSSRRSNLTAPRAARLAKKSSSPTAANSKMGNGFSLISSKMFIK